MRHLALPWDAAGSPQQNGALASSIGHDAHNIIVVGTNDDDMAMAVNRLIALQGGFVVVAGGSVLGELALPIAGLMSDQPAEAVESRLRTLRTTVRRLGCTLDEPFVQMAFLPLSMNSAPQDHRLRADRRRSPSGNLARRRGPDDSAWTVIGCKARVPVAINSSR